MSKSKKNKKRNKVNHTDNKNKFNRKKAITVTAVLLVIVVAVVALIFTMHNKANDIVGTDWVSSSAVNIFFFFPYVFVTLRISIMIPPHVNLVLEMR